KNQLKAEAELTKLNLTYDVYNYHLSLFSISISIERVFRYTIMIMANPTATSAAASAITKKTNTCPDASPWNTEKTTNNKFTELSMSSIDIIITMTFLRINTPITPMEKIKLQNRI